MIDGMSFIELKCSTTNDPSTNAGCGLFLMLVIAEDGEAYGGDLEVDIDSV